MLVYMAMTGDEIRDARERLGLTQSELGQMVGVSMRTIGNWERGETPPTLRQARLREVLAPATAVPRHVEALSDAELISELARRLGRASGSQQQRSPP